MPMATLIKAPTTTPPMKRKATMPTTENSESRREKRPRLAVDLCITSAEDQQSLAAVESKCDVQVHSVISSSKIQKKVASVLRHLNGDSSDRSTLATKPRVSILRARAADVGKLISIAEIAKREIEKHHSNRSEDEPNRTVAGRWFQYIALGSETTETPKIVEAIAPRSSNDKCGSGGDGEDDEHGGTAEFEVMQTPFERALQRRPQKHAVAVMNLFLALVPVEELRKRFGVQTNNDGAQNGKT
ncbi:hypothetical protein BX600DRAFT_433965 [Xylariales sp. PMI_506]|nr:hypothetical protein BX600DRAFT_433965 [Xylariales sp. PMI_506]